MVENSEDSIWTKPISRRTVATRGGILASSLFAKTMGVDRLFNFFAKVNQAKPPEQVLAVLPQNPQDVQVDQSLKIAERILPITDDIKSLYSADYLKTLSEQDRQFLGMYQNGVKYYLERILPDSKSENFKYAMDLVGEQLLNLSKREGSSSDFQRALDPKWEKTIVKAGDLVGYSPEDFPTAILEGLAFTESTFDTTAVNPVTGATGLFQVKPDAAHDAIRKIVMNIDSINDQKQKSPSDSIKLKNLQNELVEIKYQTVKSKDKPNYYKADLSDLQTNTVVAIEYLDYLYSLFQDRSLAVWAYHLGLGNMAQAIGAHRGKSLDHMDKLVADLGKFETAKVAREEFNKMLTPDLPNQTINFSTLLFNPAVKERLEKKGAWNDDTQYYVARCVAARLLIAGLRAA